MHIQGSSKAYKKDALKYRRILFLFCMIFTIPGVKAAFLNPDMDKVENCIEERAFNAKSLIELSNSGELYTNIFREDDRSTDKIMSQEFGISGFITTLKYDRDSVHLNPQTMVSLTGNVYLRHPSIFEKTISKIPFRQFYEVSIEGKRYLLDVKSLKEPIASLCDAALQR